MRVEQAFSSAFVVLGAESGPGNQIAFGGEPAHIDTDLRHDHLDREAADPGNGFKHFDGYAKGFDVAVDLLNLCGQWPHPEHPTGPDEDVA
jgi:hypothetical protein